MERSTIAMIVAVSLLGSVIAVQYFYGWNNVKEDVTSMGKSVWLAFKEWAGITTAGNNTTVIAPEALINNETVDTKDASGNVPFVGRLLSRFEGVLGTFTPWAKENTQYIQNVNLTLLQDELSSAIGAGVEFVNITLTSGRYVLIPLENATKRALGTELPNFLSSVRKELSEFFSSDAWRPLVSSASSLVGSIVKIPMYVIDGISSSLLTLTNWGIQATGETSTFDKWVKELLGGSDDIGIDAWTGAD